MTSQFSKDGKYFAQFTTEGKLRIWDTISNTFEQEFTPDFHLTTPCTCLHFIGHETANNKIGSPRKKKRRSSVNLVPNIVLGTSSGLLLLYSIAKADLEFTINSDTSLEISCLSTCDDFTIYSGADNNVIVWDLLQRNVKSKWSTGKEKVSAILIIPDSSKLLTASKNIKVWDIASTELLRTFTGHSSQVSFLHYVNPQAGYFISGSKQDRVLSCWNLNETDVNNKTAVANYLMVDVVNNISVYNNSGDACTNIAATVRSGVVHIYQHTLNGQCGKPLKAKTTIQIVADNESGGGENYQIAPIPITASYFRDENTLCISYGSFVKVFENIEVAFGRKSQCFLRSDPKQITTTTKDKQIDKTITPIIGNNVNYLTPAHTRPAPMPTTTKRKQDGKQEVPMEKRLENLTLNKIDSTTKIPKTDNLAQLLLQGLHSKDEHIIKTVLQKQNEQIIKNTIKRLPLLVIGPLMEELTKLIQGKTLMAQSGTLWLKNLLQIHAGLLLSNPDLHNLVGPILGCIDTRLALQIPLNKLKGRLDLLISQFDANSQENNDSEDALIVFNDKDSSDSDNEIAELDFHSESENEWDESSEEEDAENTDAVSDEEMSS